MAKAQSKEVAVAKNTAVAGFDYGDMAGSGFEGMTNDDMSIPFINVLQSNSPEVEDNDAKSGNLYNTVTKEEIDATVGLGIIPVHFERAYVEWVPRNKGGGFVGLHDPDGETVADAIANNGGNKFGKLQTGENDLIETKYMYGLLLDDARTVQGFAVLSFTSTKIKVFNDWLTSMRLLKGKPPIFANRAKITTIKQKNEHGTYHNFKIEPFLGGDWASSLIDPTTDGNLLAEAVEFQKLVLSGMARAAFDTQTEGVGSGAPKDTDEAPF